MIFIIITGEYSETLTSNGKTAPLNLSLSFLLIVYVYSPRQICVAIHRVYHTHTNIKRVCNTTANTCCTHTQSFAIRLKIRWTECSLLLDVCWLRFVLDPRAFYFNSYIKYNTVAATLLHWSELKPSYLHIQIEDAREEMKKKKNGKVRPSIYFPYLLLLLSLSVLSSRFKSCLVQAFSQCLSGVCPSSSGCLLTCCCWYFS